MVFCLIYFHILGHVNAKLLKMWNIYDMIYMRTFVINQKNRYLLLSLHKIMIFYSSKLKMKNDIDVSSWLWLHIDFIFVFVTQNSWLQQMGWDTGDGEGGGGAILLPEARHHHSPSFVPPSELTPRLLSVMRPTARPRRQTSIPYVFITLPNLPLLPPTNADPRFVFPPAFSPSSLPLGPRLAPGRPVYVPLRRLLITTWMQAGKGLLRLGRQQKATDLQFPPAAHPLIPCLLGLELSPVWLRMERGTDVHSHAHVMPVHAFVCISVCRVCMCVQVERWCCIWLLLEYMSDLVQVWKDTLKENSNKG